jgi:Flp pilus assembly protein TadD
MRKYVAYVLTGLFLVTGVLLAFSSGALAQPTAGSLMKEDVFTPLAKGYDFLGQGNYPAARFEFQEAVKRDPDNSFALNNLAVLDEREGKLKDAMSFLQQATLHAAQYKDKVQMTCFVGGLCTAAKPVRQLGPTSAIAPIVQENITRLQEKMAQAPAAPQPSTPPKMK